MLAESFQYDMPLEVGAWDDSDDFGMFEFEFEFDYLMDEAERDEEDVSPKSSSPTNENSSSSAEKPPKRKAVKARRSTAKRSLMEGCDDSTQLLVVKKKYTRRKPLKSVLYAFPSFDKSDSLLYLPVTMTRHLNSADFPQLSRLLFSHLDKDCAIVVNPNFATLNVQKLIRMYEIMDELQPDRIMCVHSTKVVENQICATIYKKFTASKTIYDSVARTISEADTAVLCDIRRGAQGMEQRLGPVRSQQLHKLMEADDCVTVYLRIELALTFDDVSKKVTQLKFTPLLTSLHASGLDFSLSETALT